MSDAKDSPGGVPAIAQPPASATQPGIEQAHSRKINVPQNIQDILWPLIAASFVMAILIYWINFRVFKQKYAEISERLDGHIDSRTDGDASPGHAYALASRGPKHARNAEFDSAVARWRHLSLAFPHLDDREDSKRALILVSRPYTDIKEVETMQRLVSGRVGAHAKKTGRRVATPNIIKALGEDFDALRHPQLAIANPAIYTFPFFLTWQRRHQWGVLPYGVHNRLGVICTKDHPQLGKLRNVESQYGLALKRMKDEKGAFWVNDPSHAAWIALLLDGAVKDEPSHPELMSASDKPRVFSVGAYLHKELLPLACAVLPDPDTSAAYAERAREIEVSALDDQLKAGPTSWPKGSAIVVVLAVLAMVLAGIAIFRAPAQTVVAASSDRLETIRRTGTLRVGYGGYPPYTIAGSGGAAPKGFSVDLVNAIASRASPPLKVEWHQFSFDTMKADLASDRFDFIADPVFMTVPRAQDFGFSAPYSFFGIAVALVKADDNRFASFTDLDRAGITIVLAEGWTSSEYARANLTRPTLKSVPVTGDATSQLDEVLAGRADVALNDVPTVVQYVRAHPGKVKALWLNAPPSSVAGGFVLRPDDQRLRDFLSTSIQVLQADGTLEVIDRNWKSLGFLASTSLKPGSGIAGTAAASAPASSR